MSNKEEQSISINNENDSIKKAEIMIIIGRLRKGTE